MRSTVTTHRNSAVLRGPAKPNLSIRFVLALSLFAAAVGDASANLAAAAPAAKTPAKKKSVVVTGEHKKALAELYGGYKFGMSKDDVLAALQKQIEAQYAAKLQATSDIAQQDRIRRDQKADLQTVASSFVDFDGHRTGWDVSIVENEFAQNTGESMMNQWENQGGKNQRRFFFFYEGKLWKMFLSLDVSILPEDKKNFDTFRGVMESKYGAGDVDTGVITWHAGDFDVRAVDRLKDYDALGLAIEDPKVRASVEAVRKDKAPAQKETSSVIKSVIDPDNKSHPDIKANDSAVDAVINAQKGGGSGK
jgi:hypothetical protein